MIIETNREQKRRRVRRVAAWLVAATVAALALSAIQSPQASGPASSPLAAYPGFGHDPVADENRFNADEQTRESMLADCMQAKGFYYAPSPSIYADGSMTREQAAALAANDPNNRYTDSLTPSQWEQYSLALAGVPDANDAGGGETGGCLKQVYDAVPGVFAAYNALREPYEQMQESIASDPRVVAADQQWSSCMSSSGYAYDSPSEMTATPDEAATESPTTTSSETQPGTTGDSAAASDAAVADYEAAGDVSNGCTTQSGLDAAIAEATNDKETAFVNQYKDVLEYYKAQGG
jgi:hypothetical protein